MRGLFVTATDTGVGKTWVSARIVESLIAEGRRVGALKPIATSGEPAEDGSLVTPDAAILGAALGELDRARADLIAPIVLPGDLAPSVAMRLSGRILSFADILATTTRSLAAWSERAEIVVVEGVGGLLCPISADATVADLAIALDFPVVIVGRRGLGTLNHVLLTVEAARWRGLRVAGVVLNGSEPCANPVAEATNAGELADRLGDVPILAEIPHESIGSSRIVSKIDVDWFGRSGRSRLSLAPDAPRHAPVATDG